MEMCVTHCQNKIKLPECCLLAFSMILSLPKWFYGITHLSAVQTIQ